MPLYKATYRGISVPDSMWPSPCYDRKVYTEEISALDFKIALAIAIGKEGIEYERLKRLEDLNNKDDWYCKDIYGNETCTLDEIKILLE